LGEEGENHREEGEREEGIITETRSITGEEEKEDQVYIEQKLD
jgi:hypothetical protein